MTTTTTRVAPHNPYVLDPSATEEPPVRWNDALKRIGPGMVLAASIVGSGELIATTTLGAQAGYTALWVVLLSCLSKPVIQGELGRYTIASGMSGLAALNQMPGPRLRGVNWLVWAWALMVCGTLLQVGAMYGGVSQVMNLLVPAVPVRVWVLVFLAVTLALLRGGGYARIERIAMVKVALFTMLTVLAALILIRMPRFFSWSAVAGGLRFELPPAGLGMAIAVFGITGVGASELFMYPYWCVEKGYAQFTGPRDGSEAWRRRARGWIRVMHLDITASMAIYTAATIAFYLLGAGVLHGMGLVPAASDMIAVLSNLYTQTLGGWALWLFYLGAVATLYGTVFAATAAHSRLFADMCHLMGFFDADDHVRRVRFRNVFVVLLSVVPVTMFLTLQSPVTMVMLGGIVQSMMLPVIAIGAIYLRHRRLPPDIAPSAPTTIALWITTGLILFVMGYYAVLTATS
ncbi:MAG: Nramp family divalent metal transporter [Acidobacteria bacterium]|nr:Nramp family divalent metal transporter [Acidobacteriota bacterium]